MSFLLGSKNNKLIDLIHKGGVNYGESMIPLTPATTQSIPVLRRVLRRRIKRKVSRRKSKKRKVTKRRRKSRR